jgi:hypothetical protein
MRLPVLVPLTHSERQSSRGSFEHWIDLTDGTQRRERWVEVYAQAVPAHIGHPSMYPDGDPYADFLPPVVDYNPDIDCPPRAVLIIDEDHSEKDGQRYLSPLLLLTGTEYEQLTFAALLDRITMALEDRFGARP